MEDAVVFFSLLHLPYSEQKRVARNMDYITQLCFSILSKRTTSITKSLKIRVSSAELSFKNEIKLELEFPEYSSLFVFLGYGEEQNGEYKQVDGVPASVRLHIRDVWPGEEVAIRCQLTLRDWILHILNIYDGSHIQFLGFSNDSRVYDLRSIRTALQGIQVSMLFFLLLDNEELFKESTKLFLPPIKKLWIGRYNYPGDMNYLQRILLQNFDFFLATAFRTPYYRSLDRLLTINASTISLIPCSVSDRTINKLFKLWIRGAMPRLQRMQVEFMLTDIVEKKNVILDKLNSIEKSEDEERTGMFHRSFDSERLTVRGGFDIRRHDGVEATIELWELGDNVKSVNFYVWSE